MDFKRKVCGWYALQGSSRAIYIPHSQPTSNLLTGMLSRSLERYDAKMGKADLVGYIDEDDGLIWTQIRGSVARVDGPWVTCG